MRVIIDDSDPLLFEHYKSVWDKHIRPGKMTLKEAMEFLHVDTPNNIRRHLIWKGRGVRTCSSADGTITVSFPEIRFSVRLRWKLKLLLGGLLGWKMN